MIEDSLKKVLLSVEAFCNEAEIAVFYGSIEDNAATEVSWTNTDRSDWKKYIETAQKIKCKILIVDVLINNTDLEDERLIDYREQLEDIELEEFETCLNILRERKNALAKIELHYIFENTCYSYCEYADWIEDFLFVQNIILESAESDEEEDAGEEELNSERLEFEALESLAREITSSDKFLSAKTPLQRNEVVKDFIEEKQITYSGDRYSIERKVERIFELEIRPKQEEQIRKQILELKESNLKKVEIASRLSISLNMVNKFYYTDK